MVLQGNIRRLAMGNLRAVEQHFPPFNRDVRQRLMAVARFLIWRSWGKFLITPFHKKLDPLLIIFAEV